jgi:glycosyltransferase involved in cell wall biosynthesis
VRIALLSWESLHSIHVGGLGSHVTELAAALERKGHEVHVFTRMGPDQTHLGRIDRVWYHRCPFDLQSSFVDEIQNMCRSFVHYLFATEDYMGAAFDVVHAHDWLTSNAMVWIKEGRGRRGILTIHSTEYGRCGNNFWEGPSARIRDHERHGTYRADRVIAVSHSLKKEIMGMYNVPDWKVEVIYNGIDVSTFDARVVDPERIRNKRGIGLTDPMVLFSGRMVYQKGPDLLVEAAPTILSEFPRTKFVFAGDGEMRWGCEQRANQLGMTRACRFVGYRDMDELIDLYKTSDAVCVPSRNEPFGIVVLEAWSAEKPVVVSQNGGPNEFVWHRVNGLKILPQPESVAWGIDMLLNDIERARWMGHNGRVAAEVGFTWDAIADRTLSVYRA